MGESGETEFRTLAPTKASGPGEAGSDLDEAALQGEHAPGGRLTHLPGQRLPVAAFYGRSMLYSYCSTNVQDCLVE